MTTTYPKRKDMCREVHRALEAHPGRSNAIPADRLREQIPGAEHFANVQMRRLILDTIRTRRAPIGACQGGYYLITSREEMRRYLDALDQRIARMADRRSLVYHAWHTDKLDPEIEEGSAHV